jgi:hypothetical protein
VTIFNKPGLSMIAYRVGTHSQFNASMRASLSSFPALQSLRTRDSDDFSIALLDAWAAVADVLSFYQERKANEQYLRTSTERRSLVQLANLIGYELRPGVAASTYLAFTLERAPGAPEQAAQPTIVEAGTKVQSIPGPNEQPQIFETIEPIDARVEWNSLIPRQTKPQQIGAATTQLYIKGLDTRVQVGDALLIVGSEREANKASSRWALRIVQSVEPERDHDRTVVAWRDQLGDKFPANDQRRVRVFAMRQRAGLFGHNAADWNTLLAEFRRQYLYVDRLVSRPVVKPAPSTSLEVPTKAEWPNFLLPSGFVDLDALYPKIAPTGWVVLQQDVERALLGVDEVKSISRAEFGLSGKVTRVKPDLVFDRARFGLRRTEVYAQSEELMLAEEPIHEPVQGNDILLDRFVSGLEKGRILVVQGKRMRIKVRARCRVTSDGGETKDLDPGETLLVLEPPKDVSSTSYSQQWRLQHADGFEGMLTASMQDVELVASRKEDELVGEVVVLQEAVQHNPEHTKLLFQHAVKKNALKRSYDRTTTVIFANVAPATHGETVQEIVGNGDMAQPYQRFTLKQPPLTYISAPTPNGAESTLKVFANDVQWQETTTLYGSRPNDRIYTIRTSDEGKATVQFGDGRTGARLPSGHNNLRAVYRRGIGRAGNLTPGRLSLLLTRPAGLKEVTNPVDAQGGDDPESPDQARRNAPLTVLTLGRVVSLQDYEDFARSFAGIGKALASWVWDGRRQSVFVTVAGVQGAEVSEDSLLYNHLIDAIRLSGDPSIPLSIGSYRKVWFKVRANIKVNPDYQEDLVLADAKSVLKTQFAFDARDLGQPVALSEIMATLQHVKGVVAVDVDQLYRVSGIPTGEPRERLLAAMPREGATKCEPAELLLLHVPSVDIQVMA